MLIGAVGTLDGLKLPVEVSPNSKIENAMYNGWLHSHLVSSVFAFSPTGMFSHVTSEIAAYLPHRGDHLRLSQRTRELARLQGRTSSL